MARSSNLTSSSVKRATRHPMSVGPKDQASRDHPTPPIAVADVAVLEVAVEPDSVEEAVVALQARLLQTEMLTRVGRVMKISRLEMTSR